MSRHWIIRLVVLGIGATFASSGSINAAVTITNGSFESPVLGNPPTFNTNIITGWTGTGLARDGVAIPQAAAHISPIDGNQVAYLDSLGTGI
jgi:hypothetical protein